MVFILNYQYRCVTATNKENARLNMLVNVSQYNTARAKQYNTKGEPTLRFARAELPTLGSCQVLKPFARVEI